MIRIISIMSMAFVCLVMFMPAVQAEDFELTSCYSAQPTFFHVSKELAPVMHSVGNGIARSDSENKFLDNATWHAGALRRGVGEKQEVSYYIRYIDPDGDIVIAGGHWTGTVPEGKWLEGTGKYKGITGSYTWKRITRGKPAMPGIYQGCNKVKGTFELPPK